MTKSPFSVNSGAEEESKQPKPLDEEFKFDRFREVSPRGNLLIQPLLQNDQSQKEVIIDLEYKSPNSLAKRYLNANLSSPIKEPNLYYQLSNPKASEQNSMMEEQQERAMTINLKDTGITPIKAVEK